MEELKSMMAGLIQPLTATIETLKEAVNVQGEQLVALRDTIADQTEKIRKLESRTDKEEDNQRKLESAVQVLDAKVDRSINSLEAKMDDMENQERRQNLIFQGVEETGTSVETWQATEDKVIKLCNDNGIALGKEMIHRAHRLHSGSRPRPIIVKLVNYHDKERVLREARQALRRSGVVVREDFSARVRQQRRDLAPLQKAAYEKKMKTFFRKDKLIVDGMAFSSDPVSGKVTGGPDGTEVRSIGDMLALLRKRKASVSPEDTRVRDHRRQRPASTQNRFGILEDDGNGSGG
jgi:DNA repair exonuclease SbcCD ATPase subunit